MSSKPKPRGGASSASSSPPPVPPSNRRRTHYANRPSASSYNHTRRSRRPGPQPTGPGSAYTTSGGKNYTEPSTEKAHRGRDLTLLLSVFNSTSSGWRNRPLTFDRARTTDEELWYDIRRIYRDELQMPWRRWFSFNKLKSIVPIEYTRNDQPIRTDPKDFPDSHEMMHCYHHPDRTGTDHVWVDWFGEFEKDPSKSYGLEFREGIWAEKLALLAIVATVAIIVVSVVWCVKGGQLQTVFTVMSFVLSGVAAEVALIALYFQVSQPS